MKKCVILIYLLIVSSVIIGQTIEQRIDTMQILIGEQTNLTYSATVRQGQKVSFPTFQPGQNITPGLEIVESRDADTVDLSGNMIKVSKSFVLTSFDEKLYYIPSQNIRIDGKPYKTKSLALKVLTIPVDTLHADKFYPAKDVQDNPFAWAEWSPVLVYSILFVLLVFIAIYLIIRYKNNKPIISKIKIVKHIPPHQKAIEHIEKLKAENAASSEDQKSYYTQLTMILRQYMAERFKFDAMEMTSGEIIERLKKEDNKALGEIIALFRTADLVKFAKHSALINENDANLMNALTFINDTKVEEQAPAHVISIEDMKIKEASNKRLLMKILIGVVLIGTLVVLMVAVYKAYIIL